MPEQELPHCAVIIATHNYKEWVLDSITSAAGQDYPSKEIVVIDDCSTDDTLKVVAPKCTDFIERDDSKKEKVYEGLFNNVPFTYIYLKENGGPSRARNIGIQRVIERSHIIAVLDADDLWKQGKLSKSVMRIVEAPHIIGGCYSDYDILNVETNLVSYESKEPYNLFRLQQDCIVHSGAILNRKALQDVGLYDETLRVCEDFDLFLRISQHYLFTHIPEDLCVVRWQPRNSTDTVSKQVWEDSYRKVKQTMVERLSK